MLDLPTERRKPEAFAAPSDFLNTLGDRHNNRELLRERQQALAAVGQYPDTTKYPVINWKTCQWLQREGVSITACMSPMPIRIANGCTGSDGRFEPDEDGPVWLMFPEETDAIFWQPRSGEICSWSGHAFALGESRLNVANIFGEPLPVLADPLEWLRRNRRGLVVLDWSMAFDRLRDLSSVAVAERILPTYRAYMKPALPALHVITEGVVA